MNLLKKITNNSRDKFNIIQKKINIKKQYNIDFEIINKEMKMIFKDKGIRKVIGDYHFFGIFNNQTKIWTWANIIPNISIDKINYINQLKLKAYIFEKNINSSEITMFFFQFLTNNSMFIPEEKYMGLIIDLLLYLSDDMYIFERPLDSVTIEIYGLVKINELTK